jgi:hypothetical protein
MRNTFNAITQGVREVIRGVTFPLVTGPVVVRILENSVGNEIPHLRIGIIKILLHAERSLARLVFTIPHGSKFSNRLIDGSRTVRTRETYVCPYSIDILASLSFDVCL